MERDTRQKELYSRSKPPCKRRIRVGALTEEAVSLARNDRQEKKTDSHFSPPPLASCSSGLAGSQSNRKTKKKELERIPYIFTIVTLKSSSRHCRCLMGRIRLKDHGLSQE